MTLLESAVVIVIIGILSVVSAVAFPIVRFRQMIASDAQQIEAAARQAQLLALNEERSEECLQKAGASEDLQRNCSNVGVAVRTGQLVLFSDFNGDQQYTIGQDVVIYDRELKSEIEGGGGEWEVFVFEATPPTISLYANGSLIPAPSSNDAAVNPESIITLKAGRQQHVLSLHPYGIIQ